MLRGFFLIFLLTGVAIVAVFGGRYLVSDLLIWRQHVTPNLEVNVTE